MKAVGVVFCDLATQAAWLVGAKDFISVGGGQCKDVCMQFAFFSATGKKGPNYALGYFHAALLTLVVSPGYSRGESNLS